MSFVPDLWLLSVVVVVVVVEDFGSWVFRIFGEFLENFRQKNHWF